MDAKQVWREIIKKHSNQTEDGWWHVHPNMAMEVTVGAPNINYGQPGLPILNTGKAKLDSDSYIVLHRPCGGVFESRTEITSYVLWTQIQYIRFRLY